jgi:hypothetical protein
MVYAMRKAGVVSILLGVMLAVAAAGAAAEESLQNRLFVT